MVWCQPAGSPSWQDGGMEHVLGIGGYFVRAADPAALSAWYRDCLGLDVDENGLWHQGTGPTVFATFESETDYFGSRAQQTMLNFRVRELLHAGCDVLVALRSPAAPPARPPAGPPRHRRVGGVGHAADVVGKLTRRMPLTGGAL